MTSVKQKGIVAAGHDITAKAAVEILKVGGNAFDAALAAFFASCVAEPVLASLGGGGFLLAQSTHDNPQLFDFFVQTPLQKTAESEIDFYPILADFGTAQQEFHIGHGSIATPGAIAGIAEIHRNLCTMSLLDIIQPACEAAREGVAVNAFQHYISDIVSPILLSTPEALALHESPITPETLARENECLKQAAMADAFEHLAREGERLFYEGEIGQRIVSACVQQGGYLTQQDLSAYRVERRSPLNLRYHQSQLFTNPAPSVGGTLIAFALALLKKENLGQYEIGSIEHLLRLTQAQILTQKMRRTEGVDMDLDADTSERVLHQNYIESYQKTLANHASFSRGTTQISVADKLGNMASMTLSNGEGSGYVIPETGIMLNNMLGEEDINPHGFHQWPLNRRIASMMSPTIAITDAGHTYAVGSGGSNRIRSAVLQVLINVLDFQNPVELAVEQPRIHYEGSLLNIEVGPHEQVIEKLTRSVDNSRLWPEKNLFFGGAHSVIRTASGELQGQGDSRRGGVCYLA